MGKMLAEGVTLIEMMVTLATIGVVLSIGVPAVKDLFATNRMSAATNDLVTTLHVARNEAVKGAEQVVLCTSTLWNDAEPDCTVNNFADGWIVFVDTDRNAARDPGEELILAHGPLGSDITLDSATTLVLFSSTGSLLDPLDVRDFDFLLCDGRGNISTGGVTAGRLVTMTPTGRPQIITKSDRVNCPG
jgi:type IV fimbrial biogenesis protein FimT